MSGLLLGTMSFGGAQAAITTLTNGQTISGIIAVNDGRGGNEDCAVSDPSKSRLQVTRVADGTTVHTASRSGAGALTSTWNTVGQPLGQYRVRSWAIDGKKSGFLNLGCTTQAEVLLSDLTVTLQNKAAVAVSLPAHIVTGESLPVTVSTTVDATGVTNQPLGGRTVTVAVPGVGDKSVVTDDQGKASTTFDLPDLASGSLAVGPTSRTTPRSSAGTAAHRRSSTRGRPARHTSARPAPSRDPARPSRPSWSTGRREAPVPVSPSPGST